MIEGLASGGDLIGQFGSAAADARPFLVAAALAANRDSYRSILSVAAMRSIDEAAFVKGLHLAIREDPKNLPALRLLSWQQIRIGDFDAAKLTLRTLIAGWPDTPDNKRELARVNMLSPGPDSAEIFELAAAEFRSRLGGFAYKCQHMIATGESVTEARVDELKLFIDRAFAQIVRNAAEHDAVLPERSVLVFLDVIRTLLAGKTIALVANGPSLRDSKLGGEIDAHDVVVRCNFPLFSKFSEDVGSRVDIVFFNESLVNALPGLLAKEPAFKDCLSLAFHPDDAPLFSEDIYAQNMTGRVSRIQPRLRSFYRDFFYTRPTTGLMGIIFLSVVLGKDVSIYGFDFYKQASIHYYPSNSPIFLGHELQYEQWFLEKFLAWLDLGKIKRT